MQFSYPGYNELLCGHPDDERINTNNPVWNPNISILEVANNTDRYKGKVLAFASWDRFIHILNEKRSHLEVNTGYRHSLSPHPTESERLVEKMQDAAPRFWEHERADVFTHEYAIEAMKSRNYSTSVMETLTNWPTWEITGFIWKAPVLSTIS